MDASSEGLGACLLQNSQPVAYASRTLNSAERNYAQIEKEMLAISWGCVKFHDYVYGAEGVVVETDHKPLENLFKKPLASAPPRIQRMMLRVQKYDLKVMYKPGREMFIADTLSRAATGHSSSEEDEYEVHVLDQMPISDDKLKQFVEETAKDPVLQQLGQYVMSGWPDSKQEVKPDCQTYWAFREEISLCDGLLLKADRLIVPSSLRRDMLTQIHRSHLGIEKCRQRARDVLFWPGMNGEISDMVSKCPICLENRSAQQKEPLLQHEMPSRPWQKLGSDLFELNGKAYILLIDYYSKYTEYTELENTRSATVIKWLKEQFARHGIPDILVSDNGPQYSSSDFADFANCYGFKHVTSSPTYAQSNGMAERAVQTLKNILKKAAQAGEDPYIAVLEWRNTPIENIGTPTQLLMGRRTKTPLPTVPTLLKPQRMPDNTTERIQERHQDQAQYYNRSAKRLPPVTTGDVVRMKTKDGWTPAVVTGHADKPRSYTVNKQGRQYRRNRRDLLLTREPHPPQMVQPFSTPDIVLKDPDPYVPCATMAPPPTHNESATTVTSSSPTSITSTATPRVSRVSGRVINKPLRFKSPE